MQTQVYTNEEYNKAHKHISNLSVAFDVSVCTINNFGQITVFIYLFVTHGAFFWQRQKARDLHVRGSCKLIGQKKGKS